MPYLHCPNCRLSTFSVARDTDADACPRCGTELAGQPGVLFPERVRQVSAERFGRGRDPRPPLEELQDRVAELHRRRT